MTKEEILEYNKRCAEFLGCTFTVKPMFEFDEDKETIFIKEYTKPSWWTQSHNHRYGYLSYQETKYMMYDCDWNWIMEVVDAIEKLQIPNYINEKDFKSDLLKRIHTNIEYGMEVRKNNDFYGHVCKITCFTFSGHQFKGYSKTSKKEAIVQAINQFLIWYKQNDKL